MGPFQAVGFDHFLAGWRREAIHREVTEVDDENKRAGRKSANKKKVQLACKCNLDPGGEGSRTCM